MFAISLGQKRRGIVCPECLPLCLGPHGIAASGNPGEPVRMARQCGYQNDRTRMEAVGRDPLDPQGAEEFDQCIGIVVDIGRRFGQRL